MQQVTKDSEQYISNKSFDPTYQVEVALLVGEDSINNVLRRVQVDASGNLKVT